MHNKHFTYGGGKFWIPWNMKNIGLSKVVPWKSISSKIDTINTAKDEEVKGYFGHSPGNRNAIKHPIILVNISFPIMKYGMKGNASQLLLLNKIVKNVIFHLT